METLKTVIILFFVAAAANAKCCPRPTDFHVCPDGSDCWPFQDCFCCTKCGSCNVFCCNCDCDCRWPPNDVKESSAAEALERFRKINTGKSGAITFDEFKSYGDTLPHKRIMQVLFNAHDLDKDGKISFEEFDKDAAKQIKSELWEKNLQL